MAQTYKVSQEGYDKLLAELKELEETKRPKAVERLSAARAMGDLAENSEYSESRSNLELIDNRIAELKALEQSAEVLDEVAQNDIVQLGDTVHVRVEGDGDETFIVVGELEADITENKISDTSPIGKALMGGTIGMKVSVEIPAGTVEYTITKIEKK